MGSNAAFNGRAKIVQKEPNIPFSIPIRLSSHRTPCFSSSGSLSSEYSYLESMSSSPCSPRSPLQLSGIPFSWEKLPGIPKKQTPEKKNSSLNLLPLPPAGTLPRSPIPKRPSSKSFRRDPFFAALVECSKDDQGTIGDFWKGSKVTRTMSDRLGFVGMYTSCKRTCAVSESIIYLPKYKQA